MKSGKMPMGVSVVWLDLDHAKIFHFSDEKMERETVQASKMEHHTHRKENDEKDSNLMYEEITGKLKDSKRILILGPGIAKTHFHNYAWAKHPVLAKRVVGCETSDHPTDHQIAAFALRYFQRPVT